MSHRLFCKMCGRKSLHNEKFDNKTCPDCFLIGVWKGTLESRKWEIYLQYDGRVMIMKGDVQRKFDSLQSAAQTIFAEEAIQKQKLETKIIV